MLAAVVTARRLPPLAVLAVLLLAVLLLAACGTPAGQPPPIVIGAVYPITGPQAPGGKDELAGVRAALAVAQRDNVPGASRVRLDVVGAETPEQARAAVDRLIDRDHVSVVVGTYGSTLAEAAAARANERKTVYWETGAVADSITMGRPYVFRTVATGSNLGEIAVRFTGDVLLPAAGLAPQSARVAIVQVDDVYGRSVADGEAEAASRLGIQVVDRIPYDPDAFDPVAVASRLKADRPDYLWDVSYVDDGIAIWREVVRQHLGLRAAVGTSSAFCMPEFGRQLGAEAVRVYAADKPDGQVNPSALSPEGRALLDQASRQFASANGNRPLSIPAVAGFVGGWALFHDVLPAVSGPLTPDAVRSAALKVDRPMGTSINGGGVQFAAADPADGGQNRRAAALVGQWLAVGVMKPVYPAAYALAQPILGPPPGM
jgi:branched-chain amino acid transport system substrate-binding protein